jgi:hypothetical protein
LLADGGAALHHAAGACVGDHRAEQTGKVDAEMLVEPPVLGGERRLDQVGNWSSGIASLWRMPREPTSLP